MHRAENRQHSIAKKTSMSVVLRFCAAVLSVTIAVVITWFLQPLAVATIYSLSFIAVIITAWYAGLWPGVIATLLAGLAIDYFFVGPPYALDFNLLHLEQVGVFMIVAVLIGSLTAARKRADAELRRAHDQLEIRVQERTRDLAKANEDLQAEIIEREKAEARVTRIAQQLEERNSELLRLQGEIGRVERLAALGKVAGSIAHDLGTPLSSVLGYTQLLTREELPENAQGRVKIIQGQVERMVSIIQQYLSRARGSFQARSESDINHLVGETLELLKPIFERQGVQVDAHLTPELPKLSVDAASLQRVLINLLDNAVDAIEPGGKINVTTQAGTSERSAQTGVVITVADTGAGIPAEMLPTIFEFFVTTKAPGQGTGMGLPVCQEIVKGHGGSIDISSRIGEGTTVRVFLPFRATTLQERPVGKSIA
jgi:C4-dicarboxylate-specific signal transduction histidine kinase